MSKKYGVIGSGTTKERLILWGAGFPVIELDVESSDTPRMTIVGADCEGGQIVEVDFASALPISANPFPLQAYEEPLRESMGWQVGIAINGGCGLYVIDPSDRYHFEFMATESALLCYLCDHSSSNNPTLVTFLQESLREKGAWPVLPVAEPLPR